MIERHGFEREQREVYGKVCTEEGEEEHDAIIIFKKSNKVDY